MPRDRSGNWRHSAIDYSFGAAIAAGVVATVVMTAMLYMGMAVMPRQMPMHILYMLGTMVSRNTMMAHVAGTMMHAMMGIAFVLAHMGVFKGLDLTSALIAWGVLFGFVHYLIVGMGMGMMGTMHPLMRSGQMQAPGFFVTKLPMPTVMGFLMVHIVYGLVVGALYDLWA